MYTVWNSIKIQYSIKISCSNFTSHQLRFLRKLTFLQFMILMFSTYVFLFARYNFIFKLIHRTTHTEPVVNLHHSRHPRETGCRQDRGWCPPYCLQPGHSKKHLTRRAQFFNNILVYLMVLSCICHLVKVASSAPQSMLKLQPLSLYTVYECKMIN